MKTGLILLLLMVSMAFREKPAGKIPIAKAKYSFKTTAEGGLLVVLDGSGSKDPDGYITSYEWNQIGVRPNPVQFNNPNIAVTTAAPSYWVLGSYRFSLKVTDNQGATSTSTVTVLVVNGGSDKPSQLIKDQQKKP